MWKPFRSALALAFVLASPVALAQDSGVNPPVISQFTNASSTGTAANKLAKLTGAPSTALIAATSDTGGVVGVVIGGAGTTGKALVAVAGQAPCVFDGATTAGDYVQISSTVAGACHDAGASYPSSGQVIGRVLSTNGGAGTYSVAINGEIKPAAYFAPQHRITLTSATPVMGSSVAAATTVFVTPYAGNSMPIYDGANVVPTVWAEVSQATTDATKSPAAVAASKVYDIFCWIDSGSNRCTRGPAWSSSTSRGYTLTMVNGILLNTSSISNGPAALRGTWVGTIASNAGSTIDFIFGTSGSNGIAGVFNVWNAYNRVDVACQVIDTAASYTYTSSTPRQAHGSATMQVSFVIGAAEDAVWASYTGQIQTTAVIFSFLKFGVGFDVTNAFSQSGIFIAASANTLSGGYSIGAIWNFGIGTHFVAAIESSDNTNANSFNVGGAANVNGLSFRLRM